jgi:L-lactate dehydrogenase complex protein LldG
MSASPSRRLILDRIRSATRGASDTAQLASSYEKLPRAYIRAGKLDLESRVQLLIERLREYGAGVVECANFDLPATIAAQLVASSRRSFVAAAGLCTEWFVPGFDWMIDHGLSAAEIDHAQGAVTAAFSAVADSGTIVLHHSQAGGRRVLTLLPDWHLCILRTSQVVETLPEYFARCPDPPPLVTWISGPSATADIEMTRIRGVHGPRQLQVIIARDAV